MTRRPLGSRLLAFVTLLPLAFGGAHAQDDTFEDSADIVSVPVPVNVVDRDGKPVRGLTADDFEIVDDGDRQQVASFEVFDLTTTTTAPTNASGMLAMMMAASTPDL